jgi:ribosomal protein S28E/S33
MEMIDALFGMEERMRKQVRGGEGVSPQVRQRIFREGSAFLSRADHARAIDRLGLHPVRVRALLAIDEAQRMAEDAPVGGVIWSYWAEKAYGAMSGMRMSYDDPQ